MPVFCAFLCISFPRLLATLHFPATRAVIGLTAKIWRRFFLFLFMHI
ncbi:hypothetical protein HMPREF9080_00849 [Cardiobacterium valvarum F0432]|uniref:Uncharacterized protein n=1 Tax=Cardiobacterium valvarum F0432 TaxID=797473 RepID=G9ZDL5_9GAMM|nr:hypothetical protein HMPREF9080_00849 [Cardiobacterium valvarum F0432]